MTKFNSLPRLKNLHNIRAFQLCNDAITFFLFVVMVLRNIPDDYNRQRMEVLIEERNIGISICIII